MRLIEPVVALMVEAAPSGLTAPFARLVPVRGLAEGWAPGGHGMDHGGLG